ncbi:SurA N-terminal domain-containing protein [Hymenobacter sp. BT186]|uniref:Periplasmic chaperone PpiD n=1 Tax=Hymenobacter telluris TaxID=2816474 RepID=A0A939EYX6_9BACT|nr:SurA N-terminal domain-containing protein [Hymenobacter telluris]MBO0359749.1 SurA N-terminal domain-containing protein [Hymenobacter telluris]MBW3375776.1 SurA N-terminal domain-containing protein [Hymenobacter norwichensis]
MALINTIREKSGWAVGTVAIGMLLFIVGGDLIGGKNKLFGGNENVVGEVAGQKIELNDFNAALEQAKQGFIQQQGRQPDEQAMGYLRDQAWNQTIYKIAFQKEFDKLGLTVSEDELTDMVQGKNIHPSIRQAFTDQQTGQFDRSKIIQYLQGLDKLPPDAQAAWLNFEANLGPERAGQKYNNLIKLSTYVTTAEAKRFDEDQNTKASLRYLFIPYFSISDSAVKVTDDQLQAYLDKNKSRYKVEDGRSIEYVTVPVVASKEDSAAVRQNVAQLAVQFASAPNDSLFVKLNSDQPYNGAYLSPADMPEKLRQQLPLTVGKVYGPYAENGTTSLFKVTGQKAGTAYAARASHILIKPEGTTPEADAAAKAKATEVLNKIKGGADFAAMARQYGTDGTVSTGGDLGWFQQGRMVPEFEKAIFGASATGLLPAPVKTSFGYHIIKITAPKTNQTYQLAAVQKKIEPSDATRDAAYAKAQELKGQITDLESLRKVVAKDKTLQKQEARGLGRGDQAVNNLQGAREVVRWAYGTGGKTTKVGDVSEVFDVNDQYVVAVLTGERSKGVADVAGLKPELTAAVRNEEKAKQIMAKLNGKNGTLEQLAAGYGAAAQVKTADGVVLGTGAIPGLGTEPLAVGKAFGLKPGQKSAPIQGEQGVLIVEPVSVQKPTTPTDIAAVRKQLTTQRTGRADGLIYEAVKTNANVKDERNKFF